MALVDPIGPTLDGEGGGQGNNAYELNFRPVAGQATASWATNGDVVNVPYPNAWIRLKRQGNNFSAFRSSDGHSWTQLGQTNQTYSGTVYVGLATTSHNNAAGRAALARYHDYRPLGVNGPAIVQQPGPVSAGVGGSAPFTVQATGTDPLSYQWRRNGTNLANATNASLTISPVAMAHAGAYQVVVWNSAGLVSSAVATLSVGNNLPPVSSGFGATTPWNQPLTLTVAALLGPVTDPEGSAVAFVSVSPASTNGASVVLSGTNVTYTPVSGFVGADRFSYVVSDAQGAQSSLPAQIAVLPPDLLVNTIQPPVATGQSFSFGFVGLPGKTYQVLRAGSPMGPWLDAGTVLIRADGTGQYSDTAPPANQAFYRLRLLP